MSYSYRQWTHIIDTLKVRYGEPYNALHSYASWSLMIDKNIGWIAEQLGNSVPVMCERYGKWIKGVPLRMTWQRFAPRCKRSRRLNV